MAACHLRPISTLSRSHPLTVSIEEQLYKLKASKSSSIGQKLNGLKNLFESTDDFLQLPTSQQILFHEIQNKNVENVFNVSMELWDMCYSTQDLFSQTKECVQELELSLRGRKSGDLSLTSEIDTYMTSRKKLNKMISQVFEKFEEKGEELHRRNLGK